MPVAHGNELKHNFLVLNFIYDQKWFLVPSSYVIMGHRHVFGTSQIFETNNDQHWNHMHPEESFVHLASSSDVENYSFFHPGDNLHTDGSQCVSHRNPAARVNEISSSSQIVHALHNPSDGLPMHSSVVVDAFQVRDNHVHHTPAPNFIVENSAFDLMVGTNGRGQYKRKSPMVPSINEMGSTSRYYCAGSSSDASCERQNVDVQHSHWESIAMPLSYNPPVGGESSLRNVRSRSSFELDPDMFRPHTITNYPHPHHSGSSRYPTDHCDPVDHSSQGPTLPLLERNHVHISTASHGRTIVADSGNVGQDASHFIFGSSTPDISGQMGGYNHDPSSSRNILQRFRPISAQTRGARSSYPQRSNPTSRVGTGSLRWGQGTPMEGLQFIAAENYSNRHPRAFTSSGWRNSDRSSSRSFADRYRSFSVDAVIHDHMTTEGTMFVDRSSFHGSRGLFDQHTELRLDVDNMSYEELLALGERIGSVNTGLSDDQLSKCLKETIYLSLEQVLLEERCVICLEEYQNMDQIGSLRSCSHEYHVGCIKKWLSMKNLCPICKAPALSDDTNKEKMKAPI